MEFTGDYYKCSNKKCNYIWDYMETNCPECGGDEWNTVNIQEEHQNKVEDLHKFELMMDSRDDLKNGVTVKP